MTWRDHELCGPAETFPASFWGPERMDAEAWRELAAALETEAEVSALTSALAGTSDVVDVGGGTGLLTRAIAARSSVTVIEPAAEQRAHLPRGITAIAGRAEQLPLGDREVDGAMATWVLQYCEDPRRAVTELARVARRRVAIVQAAPGNDLVDVYNIEARVAGQPMAHHGFLLALAAEILEAAGFVVLLERVAIAVRGEPAALADTLARLHFASHPMRDAMVAATQPVIAARLAERGALADDGVLLRAMR
jgi:SAM-dependent methyltransferase